MTEFGLDRPWRNLIAGQWRDGASGETILVEDPATGEALSTVARAVPADIDAAVRAARACVASRALVDLRPADRGRMVTAVAGLLRGHAEDLAWLIALDSGKPLSQARDEVEGSARYFEFYGGAADKITGSMIPLGEGITDFTVPVPHGVSAQIIPWNYPLEMAARSIAPALAAGNAVVVKSPELDPLSVIILAEMLTQVGLPEGAVNVLCGHGHDAGAHLAAHPGVDQIVFTGSVPTGRSIIRAAAANVVPTVMELGGKSAGVVFADADLDVVTEATRWGIFLNAGQACNAMSRLVVAREIYDEVVDRLAVMAEGLPVGPGVEDNQLTPLISAAQLQRIASYARTAQHEGAKPVTGGAPIDRPGHFMAATLLADVAPDHTVAREEVFGPVLAIIPFDGSVTEAEHIANGTDYGLAAGVFTADIDRALYMADRLEAGQVYVNDWYTGGVETPFGGVKNSGFGREKGVEALAGYHQWKNVGIRRRTPDTRTAT